MQTTHLPNLPEFDEWSTSPQWRTHLTEHGTQIDPNGPGFIVVAVEDCPGCVASAMMSAVYEAWNESRDNDLMEAIYSLSDGYGVEGYIPEQGYDWSGIRDSSPAAVARMFKVATTAGFHGTSR